MEGSRWWTTGAVCYGLSGRMMGRLGDLSRQVEIMASLRPEERARVGAIEHVLDLCFVRWQGSTAAFVHDYNAGSIPVPGPVRDALPRVSRASLFRWRAQSREGGAAALVARWGPRGGGGVRPWWENRPELADAVLALLVEHGMDASPALIRRALLLSGGHDLPSTQSIRRFIHRWRSENPQLADRIAGPNEWKGRHLVAVGKADEGVTSLADVWEIDTTPSDVLLRYVHPTGEERTRRYTVIAIVEIYSRLAHIGVIPSESTSAVVGFLLRTLLAWRRFPSVVRTDQGSAFKSEAFSRALGDLGIRHDMLPPGRPERKPFVERFLQTFSREFLPLLRGYVGPDVATRKRIRDRKGGARRLGLEFSGRPLLLDPHAFEEACSDWVHDYNERRVHSAIGCTPSERVREWVESGGQVRGFSPDEDDAYARALALLMAPVAKAQAKPPGVRVIRKGVVKVGGYSYSNPILGGAFNGREVVCRHDESDASRVVVCSLEGEFLCVAVAPDLAPGISRRDAALAARAVQAKYVREETRALQARARAVRPLDVVSALADLRRHGDEPTPAPPTVPPLIPTLDEARRAVEEVDRLNEASTLEDESAPDVEAVLAEPDTEGDARPRLWESREHRYRWCAERMGEGTTLLEEDIQFVREYEDLG